MLKDDLDEGHKEAEELDERDDGGTEREPQPAANGGWNKDGTLRRGYLAQR